MSRTEFVRPKRVLLRLNASITPMSLSARKSAFQVTESNGGVLQMNQTGGPNSRFFCGLPQVGRRTSNPGCKPVSAPLVDALHALDNLMSARLERISGRNTWGTRKRFH